MMIEAVGTQIQLGSIRVTPNASTDADEFEVVGAEVEPGVPACAPQLVIPMSQYCTIKVTFKPKQTGERFIEIRPDLLKGGPVINSVFIRAYGVEGYSWKSGDFGTCAGGSGNWIPGEWLPATGCGLTEQSRTMSCAVDINSGVRTRIIQCVDAGGTVVPDNWCDISMRPSDSEPCTPIDETACGTSPATTRTVTLESDCLSGCVPEPANHKYCLLMPL